MRRRGLLLSQQQSRVIERLRNADPALATQLSDVRLDWYRFRNATDGDGDTAELYIYEEIGGWFGMPVNELVKELREIKTKNLNVRINSPGGSLFDSIAIYNALVAHPANITVYVDALAASGASIIAMAGEKCIMMVGSQLMIHDALGVELGNAADMRAMAEFLDAQSDNIATIYANKAGGDPKDWRNLMLAETWMFAEEAVESGLADEIYSGPGDEEMPEEGEEEAPEEEDAEGDEDAPKEEEEPPTDDDEELENLMHRKHPLASRGFKFAGRNKAPKPEIGFDVDGITAAFERILR